VSPWYLCLLSLWYPNKGSRTDTTRYKSAEESFHLSPNLPHSFDFSDRHLHPPARSLLTSLSSSAEMEETINLVAALDRLAKAEGKLAREINREVAINELSPLHSLVKPLRWLSSHLHGKRNRDLTLATGHIEQFMRPYDTWEPYMVVHESLRHMLSLHPEIEARNEKMVKAWNRFKKAGAKKKEISPRQGVQFERIEQGEMLSLPITPNCDDLGFRLVQISRKNPVRGIRVDKSVVNSSDLPLILVEFIMGAHWSMQDRRRLDTNPVPVNEMALRNVKEGLAERVELLLELAQKVAERQREPGNVAGSDELGAIRDRQIGATPDHPVDHGSPGDSLNDLDSASPYHDSFLGLMLSAPAGAPLRSGSVFLCANVQSACTQSRGFNSLAQLKALLWNTGTGQEKATFLSSVAFAQEALAEQNWELLERERSKGLRRLAREYGRLERAPYTTYKGLF
jgi:hypothetical protein